MSKLPNTFIMYFNRNKSMWNSRASRARWFRAFAGPRRERKGFLVAFDVRSRFYSKRRGFTINSTACCRSHERSKHQVWVLLNGCQHPFGSEDDKRLEHTDSQQSEGDFAAFRRQVTSLEPKIWKVTYLQYFLNCWPPLSNLTSNFKTHKNLGDNFWVDI